MGAMLLLAPLPGALVRRFQRLQRRVMRRTDARVQVVTESMCLLCSTFFLRLADAILRARSVLSALRMIKLFGWERKIDGVLMAKRAEELVEVRTRELTALANDLLKCVAQCVLAQPADTPSRSYAIPVIVMIASYATYVRAHLSMRTRAS
jgi:hypothetical protein